MLSKNVNNKRCAPKLIFFNEKKIEKDLDNFWYRKLTLKVKRLGDFALTQFSKFNNFLWVCWFLGRNLSNFVPSRLKTPQPVLPYCSSLFQSSFLSPRIPGGEGAAGQGSPYVPLWRNGIPEIYSFKFHSHSQN